MLRELLGMAPERRDLSQKKSHYLASLAVRSLGRDDPRSALAFLDYADRSIDQSHLTPFLLGELDDFRRQAEVILNARCPRYRESRRSGRQVPGDTFASKRFTRTAHSRKFERP